MDQILDILHAQLQEAIKARDFHRASHAKGNIEALIAGLKINWIKDLLNQIQIEGPKQTTPEKDP